MKKSIFIISFIILSLFFSYTFVFAEDNAGQQVVNGVKQTVDGAANGVKDVAQDATNGAKDLTNNVGNDMSNGANNVGNDIRNGMDNMGDNGNNSFNATRTSSEGTANNGSQGLFGNNVWTWIIVGIIVIAIIAVIWYYASRDNQ